VLPHRRASSFRFSLSFTRAKGGIRGPVKTPPPTCRPARPGTRRGSRARGGVIVQPWSVHTIHTDTDWNEAWFSSQGRCYCIAMVCPYYPYRHRLERGVVLGPEAVLVVLVARLAYLVVLDNARVRLDLQAPRVVCIESRPPQINLKGDPKAMRLTCGTPRCCCRWGRRPSGGMCARGSGRSSGLSCPQRLRSCPTPPQRPKFCPPAPDVQFNEINDAAYHLTRCSELFDKMHQLAAAQGRIGLYAASSSNDIT
jgi:hypothetical protein